MRIAFISDLHSCLKALDDVLLDCEKRGVDKIYCLGDVIDMGPEPEAGCGAASRPKHPNHQRQS